MYVFDTLKPSGLNKVLPSRQGTEEEEERRRKRARGEEESEEERRERKKRKKKERCMYDFQKYPNLIISKSPTYLFTKGKFKAKQKGKT